jgi:cation diffusion facilitator family transporter
MDNSDSDSYAHGFDTGKRISKVTFITLLAIGIAEVVVGIVSNSIVLIADGVDSFGDSLITLIVLLGLVFSLKSNNRDKDTGIRLYRIESFAAFIAAIAMVGMGIVIVVRALEVLMDPIEITHPETAIITLACASVISGYRAYQMNKVAGKYNLISLKAGAKNAIKDSMASVIGLISVVVAVYLGFPQADPIGALIIAAFIFSISYFIIKESSLVLLDIISNPHLSDQLASLIERVHKVKVSSISLHTAGPFLHAEISIVLDGNVTVSEFKKIASNIKKSIRKSFPSIQRCSIIIEQPP